MPTDYVLDIVSVFHSAKVEVEGSCMTKCEPTTVLRDVSARVYAGEVLAILGSKGSGKRALLDVIGNIYTIFISIFAMNHDFSSEFTIRESSILAQ